MLSVQKLTYSSTCAYCDKGVEGGEGIRLLRTTGNGRTGFDFHKACFTKVITRAEGLDAPTLVEVAGVYYFPEDLPGVANAPTEGHRPPPAQKVIPKRR